jgi:hypothetical protein
VRPRGDADAILSAPFDQVGKHLAVEQAIEIRLVHRRPDRLDADHLRALVQRRRQFEAEVDQAQHGIGRRRLVVVRTGAVATNGCTLRVRA